MQKKVLRIIGYVLAGLIFLIGLTVFIYPLLNNYIAGEKTKAVLEEFNNLKNIVSEKKDSVSSTESGDNVDDGNDLYKFDVLYKDMVEYNESIAQNGQSGLTDAWSYEQSEFDLSSYGISDGVIAKIRIPKMNVDMPIYLGATYDNMEKGAAQLGQTSLPIGGENTNCVIAGHRGHSGIKYFQDIDVLEIGDEVYIDNLWETLVYRVSEIKIINPDEINEILIQDNRDLVTLITCHPYLINSHRYVVYCERVNTDKEDDMKDENIQKEEQTLPVSEETTEDTESLEKLEQENNLSHILMVVEKVLHILIPVILIVLLILIFRKNKK